MADQFAAFLSYSRHSRDWVSILHRNVELCLAAQGRPARIFLDEFDIGSGQLWVEKLQEGLEAGACLILVVTPEALASHWVSREWLGFLTLAPAKKIHVVKLIETPPLPAFLAEHQAVDFQDAGPDHYRRSLQKLVAGLLEHDPRDLPALPPSVEIAPPPQRTLPSKLRSRLVAWLEPFVADVMGCEAIAARLDLRRDQLDNQPSPALKASAALVWATGDEDPLAAAIRIVNSLRKLVRDRPEPAAVLERLAQDLAILSQKATGRPDLEVWLCGVADEHSQLIPFQKEMEHVQLAEIYVQLELDINRQLAREDHAGEKLFSRPMTLRELLTRNQRDHPSRAGRWIVLADPGAGKTTLLRHLTATLAKDPERPWIPLFESVTRLATNPGTLLSRQVASLKSASSHVAQLEALLERSGDEGRLLLLLDGLDEVPHDRIPQAKSRLRALAGHWPKTPMVVTSRRVGYRPLGGDFREVALLPLDLQRHRELLTHWIHDEALVETALAVLEGPGLRELAANPLYLTLMALLLRRGTLPKHNRPALYRQVLDLLLEGHYRASGRPVEAQATVLALLSRLAYAMTEDNLDAQPLKDLEARLNQPWAKTFRDVLDRQDRWRGRGMRHFLEDIADRTNVLAAHNGTGTDWTFWHPTFREALTAERLAEIYRGKNGPATIFAMARKLSAEDDLARWAEPFALLAGQIAGADELVVKLVEANRPLGLRALATAQGLNEGTLKKVLDLSEDWRQRAEIYRRLPEMEPLRALALIDELRQRTTDGNDLFFLDQAIREVARRSPELRQEAVVAAAQLFAHIPAPPRELFEWIETPCDGRVPLWRKIPAGEVWIGSPEGEGDADEHPRHRVTIAQPFWLAAVPVTNTQYRAFDKGKEIRAWPGVAPEELSFFPCVDVTWYEAVSFCRWLSAVLDVARGVRLPSEEEWEYACRAGTETRYWSGGEESDLSDIGWYGRNSGDRPHRVGEKPASPLPWGLYDMHGNVWEWTLSHYTSNYEGRENGKILDPTAVAPWLAALAAVAPGGGRRVMRGGSCWDDAGRTRAAYRNFRVPGVEVRGRGFRLLLPPTPA